MTIVILEGLNEAGQTILGVRQCEEEHSYGRCQGIVRPNPNMPDSPYSRFCTDCLIHVYGKGD